MKPTKEEIEFLNKKVGKYYWKYYDKNDTLYLYSTISYAFIRNNIRYLPQCKYSLDYNHFKIKLQPNFSSVYPIERVEELKLYDKMKHLNKLID